MGGIIGTSKSNNEVEMTDDDNKTSNETAAAAAAAAAANEASDEKNDNNKRESATPATAATATSTSIATTLSGEQSSLEHEGEGEPPACKKQRVEDAAVTVNPAEQQQQQHQQQQQQRGGKATSKKKVKTKHMDPRILKVRKIIQEGCRTNDLASAMEAYEGAIRDNIRIEAQSYYNLLNLCDGLDREERKLHVGTPKLESTNANANDTTAAVGDANTNDSANANANVNTKPKDIDARQRQNYVFAIKERMQSKEINLPLNETAYSAIVKILSKNKEFAKAEDILTEAEGVQQCKPKLRLYASLLHAYCREEGETGSSGGRIEDALRCWRRLRKRSQSDSAHKGSDKNSENADGMDLTEREYLSLLRCACRAAVTATSGCEGTGTDLVVEDVLTRLAEDIPVPAKGTVAAIADWFELQNNNDNNSQSTDPSASTSAEATIRALLDEIRTYDAISEPSPRMGPVILPPGKKQWTISPSCSIDGRTGRLTSGCLEGCHLQPVPLSDGSFRDMTTMNESIVTDGNVRGNAHSKFQGGRKGKKRTDFSPEERRREWKRFDDFLESAVAVAAQSQSSNRHRPFEVVIDGANIGYFKQNFASAPRHVDYEQIDWVLRHFSEKLGKKVLLVMHHRHFSRHLLPHKYRPLCDAWKREGLLYATPPGMNDDWFWMHAALKYKTLVVTNDEMRDHHFQMLAPKFFLRWKGRHQVHFDFGNLVGGNYSHPTIERPRRPREVLLTYPDVYSRRIQRVADGLVVPLTKRGDENRFLDGCHVASEQEPVEERYLCIRPA